MSELKRRNTRVRKKGCYRATANSISLEIINYRPFFSEPSLFTIKENKREYLLKVFFLRTTAFEQQSGSATLAGQLSNKKASITIAIVIGVFYLTSLQALAFPITEVASKKHISCQENKTLSLGERGHFSWLTQTQR